MARVDAGVNVKEQLLPLFRVDTSEEHPGGASVVELPAHKLIAFGTPHQPMSISDIIGEDPTLEEVGDGHHLVLLVPRWMG